jgi:isocitrate lyase
MSTVGTPKSPEQIQHDWDNTPAGRASPAPTPRPTSSRCRGMSSRRTPWPAAAAEVLWDQLHDMTSSMRWAR